MESNNRNVLRTTYRVKGEWMVEETSINSRLLQTSPVPFYEWNVLWVDGKAQESSSSKSPPPPKWAAGCRRQSFCVDSSLHIVSRLQVWWARWKKLDPFHMCLRWWSFAFLLICGLIFNFMPQTWTWSHRSTALTWLQAIKVWAWTWETNPPKAGKTFRYSPTILCTCKGRAQILLSWTIKYLQIKVELKMCVCGNSMKFI